MTSGLVSSIKRFDQRSLLLTALIEHDADDHGHDADDADHTADADAAYDHDADAAYDHYVAADTEAYDADADTYDHDADDLRLNRAV